jgi:hypothetical protein
MLQKDGKEALPCEKDIAQQQAEARGGRSAAGARYGGGIPGMLLLGL